MLVGATLVGLSLTAFLPELAVRPPPEPEGWVSALFVVGVLAFAAWLLRVYLRYQRTFELHDGSILITSWWNRWRGRDGEHVALRTVQKIVLRRPALLDFETTNGVIRFSTLLWRNRQEREIEALAQSAGLPFSK